LKLNRECVRDILLVLEEFKYDEILNTTDLKENERLSKYDFFEAVYAIEKLKEAGYINGKVLYADNTVYDVSVKSITWDGHQFLDNIRDDGIWKVTKNIASKFSSVSISMLSNIASTVISQLISKELGGAGTP
jgi:Hypothetical protein (DUF2513).